MALVPHPGSELIREPGLLVPGRKPVGSVRVDWGSSLAKDLIAAAFDRTAHFNDGTVPASVFNVSRSATGAGQGIKTDGTSEYAEYLPPSGSIVFGTDWSVLAVYAEYATPRSGYYERIIFVGNSAHQCVTLQTYNANILQIAKGDGSSSNDYKNFIHTVSTAPTIYIVTSDSTLSGTFAYANGKSMSADTDGWSNNDAPGGSVAADRVYFGRLNFYTSAYYGQHRWIGGGYIWNRILTDGEIQALSFDPYQFLIPA